MDSTAWVLFLTAWAKAGYNGLKQLLLCRLKNAQQNKHMQSKTTSASDKKAKVRAQEKEILMSLVRKDFKARYMGSRLGGFWGIVSPLLLTIAIGFVFSKIFVLPVENPLPFVLAGFFPWLFLNESLTRATRVLLENRKMFDQFRLSLKFPLMASVLSNFLCFIINMGVLVIIACVFGRGGSFALVWLPLIVVTELFFVTGLSLLLCVANVFLKDVKHIIDVGLMLWFWATPVFYSPEMVPERFAFISALNPMSVFISAYRQVLCQGRGPDFLTIFLLFVFAAAFYVPGFIIFSATEKRLIKWL